MTRAAGPLCLALDQGGHASRALVFDARGAVVARSLVEVASTHPAEDRVEQDPEGLVASLNSAVAQCAAALGTRVGDIAAAGLATQRSSIVCWDRETGRALSPVLSWQDRRAAHWLESFRARAAEITQRTGLVLSPHYGASKLRWCLDHLPAVAQAQQAGRLAFGPLASFLLFRLLRERPLVVDPANAARTLLWNPDTLDWDDALLQLFGIPRDCLPQCTASRATFGSLAVTERAVPLTIATGDQSAAIFFNGQPRADRIFVNLGTGAFAQCPTGREPRRVAGLLTGIVYHSGQSPLYVLEGTVNGAGAALGWAAGQLSLPDLETRLAAWLEEIPEPPLFLNGIGGLGAPFWVSDFPSRFVAADGVAAEARAVAVAESIVFLLMANIERMPPAAEVRVSGGLSRLDGLCQRLADLTGVTVQRSREPEATARGLAFLVAGCPADWTNDAALEEFRARTNAALRARYRRWRAAMDEALRPA